MATSLLRLGRLGSLKCLLHESWATQRTPFVAALCTKGDAPAKTTKKAKVASKTIEAEERDSLLAYKPAVAFPSKLCAAGFLPKDIALGETESSAKVTTESIVAEAATTELPHPASQSEATTLEGLTKEIENASSASDTDEAISAANADKTTGSSVADTAAEVAVEEISEVQTTDDVTTATEGSEASDVKTEVQQDEKDTSSSSSSDSESDSDEENPEKPTKTETVKSGGKNAGEKEAEVLTNKLVESESVIASSALFGKLQKDAKAVTKTKPEEVVTPSTEAADLRETLIDAAPVLSTSMTEAISEVTSESITVVSPDEMVDTASEVKTAPSEDIVENEAETKAKAVTEETQQPVNIKTSAPVVPEDTIEVADTIVEASPGVVTKTQDVDSKTAQEVTTKPKSEDASETVAKAVGATGIEQTSSEDPKDPPPEAADSVESLTETEVVETSEEQAPEKAPEPEPFDNTTYKNLQHHHYNMYTFADMDVEMSNLRLPQPSSGRPSPRH